MLLEPHHDGSALHVCTDSPDLGDWVRVRVRVPHDCGVTRVHVRSIHDAEPSFAPLTVDSRDEHETWWSGSIVARNPITSYRFLLDGPGGYGWLNATGWHRGHDLGDVGDFLLSAHPPPPDWVRDASVLQIFPDRFARSAAAQSRATPDWAERSAWAEPVGRRRGTYGAQLYGGDLDGIVEHLDHVERLGVDVLYLTPVFPAGSTHRYDAQSFDQVDPLLGGDDALVRLVQAAHARGIRVIGDLTTNHTGSRHEWFRRAQADPQAPEAAYYSFRSHPGDYECWSGHRTLPKLDWRSTPLRERFLRGQGSVVGRWLRPPVELDGWRVDVANMTGRMGAVDEAHSVAREIRATMADLAPDAWLVAEHCFTAAADLTGDGWHGTMNYATFLRPVWTWLTAHEPDALTHGSFLGVPTGYGVPRLSGPAVVGAIRGEAALMPWRSALAGMNALDTHDTPRFLTVVGGDVRRYEAGLALLFTMPGAPCVFAGAELGLGGADGERSRQPLPWDRPETWSDEMLGLHEQLAALRRESPALRRGGLRWLAVQDDVLVFERESADGERVLVQVARADHEPVALADWWFEDARRLFGRADPVRDEAGQWALPATGPGAHVWRVG